MTRHPKIVLHTYIAYIYSLWRHGVVVHSHSGTLSVTEKKEAELPISRRK